jgi:hypothetical protein
MIRFLCIFLVLVSSSFGSIVSSTLTDHIQANGKRNIREIHIDNLGAVFTYTYQAEDGFDVNAAMTVRATHIVGLVKESEIQSNVTQIIEDTEYKGTWIRITFSYSNLTNLLAELRSRYVSGDLTHDQIMKIAKYVWSLGLTDNQLKALFSVNDAQLPALKTKLSNQAALYDSVGATTGQ